MEKDLLKIGMLICVTIVIVIIVTNVISNIIIENETKNVINTRSIRISLLSQLFANNVLDSLTNLEVTSQLEQVKNSNYANYISSTIHGIPENMDVQKRLIAKQILSNNHHLATVRFFMPNGDIYMQEPYSAQLKLKQLNYAYRDYFNGTVSSGKPYVSEVFQAQSIDLRDTVALGVPIYSSHGVLMGVWSALFDPTDLRQLVHSLSIESNSTVMIFDHKGHLFVGSNGNEDVTGDYSKYANYINLSTNGSNGYDISFVQGIKMFIVYHEMVIGNKIWGIIIVQPFDNAFFVVNQTHELFNTMIISSILVSIISVLVAYFLIHAKFQLADLLKVKNLTLENTKKQLEIMYDENPDLLCIVDTKGILKECNKTYASALGYAKVELVGKSVFEYVADKSMEKAMDSFSSFITIGSARNIEIWLKHRNGREFPTLISANGRFDESSKLIEGVVTIKNITEIYEARQLIEHEQKLITMQLEKIKKVNKKLIESELKYQSLYENSPDLYSTLDLNDMRIDCNKSYVENMGYRKEELIGTSIFEGTHFTKYDALRAKKILEQVKKGKSFTNLEFHLMRKDGTSFPVLVNVVPIKNEHGEIIGTNAMMRDTTLVYEAREREMSKKLIKLEFEQLAKIDKQKDEFTAMISHELKTPIAPIKGYCEMLLEPNLMGCLNDEQHDAVEQIFDSSRRLERIVFDLLDIHKLELGQVQFRHAPFSVDMLLSNVYRQHLSLTLQKKISFMNLNSDVTSIVFSDIDRLSQVFNNLILNAIDFVPEKNGMIAIGVIDKEDTITFFVKDNGIGISRENQQFLFKKFYQVDTSYRRSHRGSGLGLPICKGIIEGLGGNLRVESKLGSGSTFYFEFQKSIFQAKTYEIVKNA